MELYRNAAYYVQYSIVNSQYESNQLRKRYALGKTEILRRFASDATKFDFLPGISRTSLEFLIKQPRCEAEEKASSAERTIRNIEDVHAPK